MARYSLGELVWKIVGDSSELHADMQKSSKHIGQAQSGFEQFGKTVGAIVSAGTIIALGKQMLQTGVDFGRGLGDVASLIPGTAGRIDELKKAVKDLAVDTGTNLGDLTGGLYQVISAFGDTADTAGNLETATIAAKAGVATVTDAVNLLSAVTKAYGDTSAGAQRRVSDFAFTTVRLGQTTFPQLAASIQLVTDRSQALGVSQEELFTVFSTLTGVTGEASMVATQLRAALVSLDSPTDQLKSLYEELGVSSARALIEQRGLQEAFQLVQDYSERTGITLVDLVGRVEAVAAISTIAGSQADTYADKLLEMRDAVGATNEAFEAQTTGVGETAFALDTLRATTETLMTELSDAFAPAVSTVVQLFKTLVDGFRDLPQATQVGIVSLVGGAGLLPALVLVGQKVGALFQGLMGPVGIVLAIGSLATVVAVAIAKSRTWQDELDNERKALEQINATIEDAEAMGEQATKAQQLLDTYKQLTAQSVLTAEQESELRRVIVGLGETLPQAATAWDEYGKAVSVNVETATTAIRETLEARKSLLEAAKARLEVQLISAEATRLEIEEEVKTARERRAELAGASTQANRLAAEGLRIRAELDKVFQQPFNASATDRAFQNALDRLEELGAVSKETADNLRSGLGPIGTNVVTILDGLAKKSQQANDQLQRQAEHTAELEKRWGEVKKILVESAAVEAELTVINKDLAKSTTAVATATGEAAAAAAPKWQKFLAELLNVPQEAFGNQGAKAVEAFLAGFESKRDLLKRIAEETGQTFDISGALEAEGQEVAKALEALLTTGADPRNVDLPFSFDDESVQALLARMGAIAAAEEKLEGARQHNAEQERARKAERQAALTLEAEGAAALHAARSQQIYDEIMGGRVATDAELEQIREAREAREKATADYELQLIKLTETEEERIERERAMALEAAGTYQPLIDAVNKYYDRLKDDAAIEKFKQKIQAAMSTVATIWGSIQNVVGAYFDYELNRAEGNEQQQEDIRRRQFQANKAIAAVNAGISGAGAIMKAFEQLGPIGGAIAAIPLGILTATQIGFILAQQYNGPSSAPSVAGAGAAVTDRSKLSYPSVPEQSSFPSRHEETVQDAAVTNTLTPGSGMPPNGWVVVLDGERVGRFVAQSVEDSSDSGTLRINARAVRG